MHLQIPEEVPHPQDADSFDIDSPLDMIVFIVLPLLMIAAFFFWRKSR